MGAGSRRSNTVARSARDISNFVFMLENSLVYVSSLEIYRCPRILPTLTLEKNFPLKKSSSQIEENLALLYFTVTTGALSLSKFNEV